MSKFNPIYLCGPIHGRSDQDCQRWRELAASYYPGPVNDPMRRDARDRMGQPGLAKEIVEADKQDIDRSSGLLVFFDQPSVGTAMEIFYAHEQGKPIVTINASGVPNEQTSLWLQYHSTEMILMTEWDRLRAFGTRIAAALVRLDSLINHN